MRTIICNVLNNLKKKFDRSVLNEKSEKTKSDWHLKREAHKSAFNFLSIFIQEEIIEEGKIFSFKLCTPNTYLF